MSQDPLDLATNFNRVRDHATRDLDHLRGYALRVGLADEEIAAVDQVIERVRRSTFAVGIVGEFKRGKSTLINALLGQAVLPTDDLPCSAAISRVRYGLEPIAQLHYRSAGEQGQRSETIPIDELSNYITQLSEESTERAASLQQAIVFCPLKFLEQNEIIDTPGMNDSQAMSEVTFGVLPEVDAAIMVVMPQAPFGRTEAEFLNHLLDQDVGRVIFVVNRIDQVRREQDRARVIAEISTRIRESTQRKAADLYGEGSEAYKRYLQRIGSIRVFGVSAKQALLARQTNDDDLLARSGFAAFEERLQGFLNRERGAVRLKSVVNRTINTASQVIQTIAVREGALSMSKEQFDSAYEASSRQLNALSSKLDEQIQRLDETAERTRSQARAIFSQIGPELKQLAKQLIDAKPISVDDLEGKRYKVFLHRLNSEVSAAITFGSQALAERVQVLVRQELTIAIERLEGLAADASEMMRDITLCFTNDTALSAPGLASVAFGRVAGRGAAAVGGAIAMAAIGLPALWPVALVLGVASFFGHTFLTRRVLLQARIDKFREQYLQAVSEAIDAQLAENGYAMLEQIDAHVRTTFDTLKRQARSEIGGAVEQLRRTVDALQRERERSHIYAARDLKDFADMKADIERMLNDIRIIGAQIDRILEEA